jgi:pimeloyl-ACP methyl ester carboxylesterase
MHVIYLHGLAGGSALSPALQRLMESGIDVAAPALPGFDGRAGWEAPPDHLGWLTAVWDRVDETGALPCPVIGASIGGMFAAELAIFRPEAVPRLVLLGPVGICDDERPGEDVYALPGSNRLKTLFAGEIPAAVDDAFSDLGEDAAVARYLSQVAGASLVWPLPDRNLDTRVHRITQPTLVLWGGEDRVAPPHLAARWARGSEPVVVPGAGHLLEWDAPDAVSDQLLRFLCGDGREEGR